MGLPETSRFAHFLKELMLAQHLSAADFARRLGVSQSQVSRWRRGEGGVSLESLDRLHDEFGIDLNYLKQLTGLRTSEPSTVQDAVDAERKTWGAWYQHLMDERVPKVMWTAYTRACEALAEVYRQMPQGPVNSPETPPVNRSGPNSEGQGEDAQNNHLSTPSRRSTAGLRFANAAAVPAR